MNIQDETRYKRNALIGCKREYCSFSTNHVRTCKLSLKALWILMRLVKCGFSYVWSDGGFEEWHHCKTIVKNCKYPLHSLGDLWEIMSKYHSEELPGFRKLVCLAATHPVHTSDCERTFSVQNMTLTARRNRLNAQHCDQIMRIIMEGENIKEFNFIGALEKWRHQCTRRIFSNTK